jgi:hypothetical protein
VTNPAETARRGWTVAPVSHRAIIEHGEEAVARGAMPALAATAAEVGGRLVGWPEILNAANALARVEGSAAADTIVGDPDAKLWAVCPMIDEATARALDARPGDPAATFVAPPVRPRRRHGRRRR